MSSGLYVSRICAAFQSLIQLKSALQVIFAMNYYQEIRLDDGIIETTLKDGVSAQELRMSIEQAFQSSMRGSINRYLVDASSAISVIPLLSIYRLPQLFSSKGLSRSSRIAVLSSMSERGKDRARFFVNVCSNRGWQAEMFFHRDEAVDWLLAE